MSNHSPQSNSRTLADESVMLETLKKLYSDLEKAFQDYREYKKSSKKSAKGIWQHCESYDYVTRCAADFLEDGGIAQELELVSYFEFLARMGADYLLTPVFLGTVYCVDAQRAFLQKDYEGAQKCIERAIELAAEFPDALTWEKNNRKRIGKSGGDGASNARLGNAKQEVQRLLVELCPLGGWVTPSDAVAVIAPEMKKFIEDNHIILDVDEFSAVLKKWLAEDKHVKSVFDKFSYGVISKSGTPKFM